MDSVKGNGMKNSEVCLHEGTKSGVKEIDARSQNSDLY